jgi:hypothetical protein
MEFVKRVSYCKLGRVPVTGAVLLCPALFDSNQPLKPRAPGVRPPTYFEVEFQMVHDPWAIIRAV